MIASKRRLPALLLVAVFALVSLPAVAAPEAELWERWTAHDPDSTSRMDHGDWDDFVAKYVARYDDGVNRVDYANVTSEDRAGLAAYIERLAASPISAFNRAEQLAFWINLYNALTVRLILDHIPVQSIRDIDISPGFFSDGPWGKKLVAIEGEEVSLDDIEHRILRPIWRDPRIHYAVNCASLGCPNLRQTAFTSSNTQSLLDRAARDYVNNFRGVEIDDGRLVVSSLYEWFQEDFGDNDEAVIAHLRSFAAPELAAALAAFEEIDDDRYDWSLNAAASR